jgi:hypothetical protein
LLTPSEIARQNPTSRVRSVGVDNPARARQLLRKEVEVLVGKVAHSAKRFQRGEINVVVLAIFNHVLTVNEHLARSACRAFMVTLSTVTTA